MTDRLNTILLVDDDPDTNMILTHVIQANKLAEHVAVAFDGEEALEFLKKNPAPDLILLDINMPRMNGWEFLEAYEKLFLKRKTPVIVMVTVSLNPEDKERAEKHNIYFQNKPLTTEVLKSLIENCEKIKIH